VASTELQQKQQLPMRSPARGLFAVSHWNASILLIVSLSITGFLTHSFQSIEKANATHRFESACKQIQLNIEARLRAHEQVLKGGAALFNASTSVERQEWHDYSKQIELDDNFKGIQGFGFTLLIKPTQLPAHIEQTRREGFPDYRVWPEGPRDIYTSIVYLEPFEGRNLRALGYDMWSEPVRRAAMAEARDQNTAVFTGKVTLVQETEHEVQPGVLMYVPVYRNGTPTDTIEHRRAALFGWVYSPFRMKDLMQGINDIPNQGAVHMKIYDGANLIPSALLYDSAENAAAGPDALISHSSLGGREWTLQFIPPAGYLNIDYGKTWLVAVGGSSISLLVFFLINAYRNTHRDALLIADNLAAELRQSETRYRILVEQSSDAILVFDPETLAIDEVNLRFCQILGYSYEQSRQLLLTDILCVPKPQIQAIIQCVMADGCRGLEEQVFRTSNGSQLDVEVSKNAVQVGLKKKIITTVRDISSRKRAETERARMERQLQQSQKMEALGQLTGGIAHDFNNILAVMLGYSNLALTRFAADRTSPLAHYLEEIIKAGERARDLVVRMLTYSRSQNDEAAVAIEPAPLVKEAVKMLASTIPSSIKLQDEIVADAPAICINPGELHQIVMNLIINARDAMAEHGLLTIRLSAFTATPEHCKTCKSAKNNALCQEEISGRYVSLSVTDNGCGISPENFKLIFDPFFTTKDVGKGTGLGLSVVQGIVRRAGGCIIVDSLLGVGTTIRILFPAADISMAMLAATAAITNVKGGDGARILVIDDEPALANYLVDLLENESYLAEAFTDPVKALSFFRDNPQNIDAVITDQTMPNKSGIEIASVMLAVRPDLPIFLCSGYSDTITEASARSFGIRRFFYKPVSAAELLSVLAKEITNPVKSK
jgi:two-component system cell cycle sensor histidine kinase/response regulator CckA